MPNTQQRRLDCKQARAPESNRRLLTPARQCYRTVMLPDGYHQLPPGKIANAVAWLEMRRPERRGATFPDGVTLEPLAQGDLAGFLDIFVKVGLDWLWSGFLGMPRERQLAVLADPNVETRVMKRNGEPAGLLQTERDPASGDMELAYFGVVPSEFGKGAGAPLLAAAIDRAAELSAPRLWLHTCHFDHPGAVAFYRWQGFRVYAQGFEIMDDPRVLGLLPKDAAPQVPMVDG
jgi:GNAT superfamily N-acetyltransferase